MRQVKLLWEGTAALTPLLEHITQVLMTVHDDDKQQEADPEPVTVPMTAKLNVCQANLP